MISGAAKRKARVRTLGRMRPAGGGTGAARARASRGMRRDSVMRAVVWPPGCPWPGVWMWPGPFGGEGPEGPGGTGGPGAPGGAVEWSPAEFRRALGIAIAIVLAGLLIGALIAAWAGGGIPGPARSPRKPPAESQGESPGGSPARPGALPERPSPGYPAPGIDCRTTGGERVRLGRYGGSGSSKDPGSSGDPGGSGDSGDCADGVVLLTFFSTASGASLAHLSVLAEMHAEGLQGVRVLAIAVSQAKDAVVSYMEARKLDLPVIADSRGELARLYDITAVPTTFVIDAQGIVRDLRVGAMTRAQLERAMRSAF